MRRVDDTTICLFAAILGVVLLTLAVGDRGSGGSTPVPGELHRVHRVDGHLETRRDLKLREGPCRQE